MFPFNNDDPDDLLATYLQDHLSAATLGLELAERLTSSNRDDPRFGPVLAQVRDEIRSELATAIETQGGTAEERVGVIGTELRTRMPSTGDPSALAPVGPAPSLADVLPSVARSLGVAWGAPRAGGGGSGHRRLDSA